MIWGLQYLLVIVTCRSLLVTSQICLVQLQPRREVVRKVKKTLQARIQPLHIYLIPTMFHEPIYWGVEKDSETPCLQRAHSLVVETDNELNYRNYNTNR